QVAPVPPAHHQRTLHQNLHEKLRGPLLQRLLSADGFLFHQRRQADRERTGATAGRTQKESTMITYLLQVTLIHSLLMLGYWMFLKNETRYGFLRGYLLATPLLAVVLP